MVVVEVIDTPFAALFIRDESELTMWAMELEQTKKSLAWERAQASKSDQLLKNLMPSSVSAQVLQSC